MKSTAGVFVNNVKVEMSPLHNGDHIRLGNTELEFREYEVRGWTWLTNCWVNFACVAAGAMIAVGLKRS